MSNMEKGCRKKKIIIIIIKIRGAWQDSVGHWCDSSVGHWYDSSVGHWYDSSVGHWYDRIV